MPSYRAGTIRSGARPAAPADLVGSVGVDRKLAIADPQGEPLAQALPLSATRTELGQLLAGSQHDQLGELDSITIQLAPELVQRGLDQRRLGDCVAATCSGHRLECNTGATPS